MGIERCRMSTSKTDRKNLQIGGGIEIWRLDWVVEQSGFEPPTSGLQSPRSPS